MLKNSLTRLMAGLAVACVTLFSAPAQAETDPKYYAVEVSATVQASPAAITLSWVQDPNATSYNIYRKPLTSASWSLVATVAGSATSWTDYTVAVGGAYEYRFDKSTTVGYRGNGYIYAGVNAPMIDARGKVLLLVDNTFTVSLSAELARLEQDLVGDGWTVVRKDFSRNDSVTTVKSFIKNSYTADPGNTKAVFLFGHIAVPYSGNYAPDGHIPDHVGAWPADLFYGDVNGNWTDHSVSATGGHRAATHNVPGDGKFDQSSMPSDVELYVGRVDLYNMTCYANKTPARSETDLMRQYLNKDHNFRHKKFDVERRGLVSDNFGETGGEAFAASGWRAFAPFFGAGTTTKIGWGSFFPTLNAGGYLWAYGTGGGTYTYCNGVGGSDDFAVGDPKAVFSMFLGSYFGDWDSESNFLRAHLGTTTYGLTAVWAGRPHWFFHHMGLGQPIGYSTKVSQNNDGVYPVSINWCARNVHTALMGDPTLRLHSVAPAVNVAATLSGSTATITWGASPDSSIVGYHVYRGATVQGPFTKLTSSAVTGSSFTDPSSASGTTYMVRAVKLEVSGSGTYYNPSQGVFATAGTSTGGGTTTPVLDAPSAPAAFYAAAASSAQVNLSWTDTANNETGFTVERKAGANGSWAVVATLGANSTSFASAGLASSTTYYFRVRAYNFDGYSAYTAEAGATTPAPTPVAPGGAATFVKKDTTTGGSWKGVYGADGAMVLNEASTTLKYATVTGNGNAQHVWVWNSADGRALQKVNGTDRVAACWYNASTFTVDINITDGQTHPLAIYCVDWDYAGRTETVEILDGNTGAVLNSQSLSSFQQGAYLVWNVSGKVRIRFTTWVGNSVLSGIFFGAASTTTTTPPVTSPAVTSVAKLVTIDSSTGGNWQGVYGAQGFNVIGHSAKAPAYASVSANAPTWVWSAATTEKRALQKPGSQTDRVAGCWYANDTLTFDISMNDTSYHRVGLYFLDYDGGGTRAQKIEIFDKNNGKLLYGKTIFGFQQGQHMVFDMRGNLTVKITRAGSANVVMSGIFFSPTP